jgi:hypothetical protein
MFRLQEQFQRDPNENIIIEGTANELKYLINLLWLMQNGSIGFENEQVTGVRLNLYSSHKL